MTARAPGWTVEQYQRCRAIAADGQETLMRVAAVLAGIDSMLDEHGTNSGHILVLARIMDVAISELREELETLEVATDAFCQGEAA